jgi:hypothetical protein
MADDKDEKVVKRGKGATRLAPKLKKTDVLYLYDETDSRIAGNAERYASEAMNVTDSKKIKGVGSWEALVRELKKYSRIDHLILNTHGAPGQLFINGVNHGIGESSTEKLFEKVTVRIDRIDFASCNVAQDAQAMVTFGKLFSAKRVSGWTRYMVTAPLDMTIPRGNTKQMLDQTLEHYKPYLSAGTPSTAELARATRNADKAYEFLLVWFRTLPLDDRPPMRPSERNFSGRERTYLPQSAAGERVVKSADAASIGREFKTRVSGPFLHVAVTIP